MSVCCSSACHSQRDMQCIPVASYFAAKVHFEFMNSKLWHGMALHGQIRHTHTVSELGCQGKVTKQLCCSCVCNLKRLGPCSNQLDIVAVIRNLTGLPALQIEPQSKELKV